MEQRITNETMAAEKILAILYAGNTVASDNAFEAMDNWQWATDANNDIQEVI